MTDAYDRRYDASSGKPCAVDGCLGNLKLHHKDRRPRLQKGYCNNHYAIFAKYGDPLAARQVKEGRKNSEAYKSYRSMLARCKGNSSGVGNHIYRDRGITICKRWLGIDGFTNFLKDMGERPEGHTIDRIDNEKGYSPENCRWATRHQQIANRRVAAEVVGVTRKYNGCWDARLYFGGKMVFQKVYKHREDAVKARKEAETQYGINLKGFKHEGIL